MARPLRNQWRVRTVVRRRHRTWIASMVCASLGWGVWWTAAFLLRLAPEWAPSFLAVSIAATAFAVPGLLLAVFTLRGRRSWIALSLVPLFANASLLALPEILGQLRERAETLGADPDAPDRPTPERPGE